jgi:hypothetical protein
MFKQYAGAALITLATLATLATGPALAHGVAVAKHGGIVQMANDLSFELVARPEGVAIYIEDHGKPLAPTGMSGRLTILSGTQRSQAALEVVAGKLQAQGVKLTKGSRVVASLTTAQQQTITVRFVVQ